MIQRWIYLGTIRNGREQSDRSRGPNGAQEFFSNLGQIHCSSLGEQEEREQEENPRALDPSLAQITIENKRIPQHTSKGKQVRLHLNLRRRDPPLTAAFHSETAAFTSRRDLNVVAWKWEFGTGKYGDGVVIYLRWRVSGLAFTSLATVQCMNVIVAPSLGTLVDEKWIRIWDQTLTLRASGFVCRCFTKKIKSRGMGFGISTWKRLLTS